MRGPLVARFGPQCPPELMRNRAWGRFDVLARMMVDCAGRAVGCVATWPAVPWAVARGERRGQ